jgi:uncharacterized membrane protein
MKTSLKNSFITGLVLTLPIGITLFFVDIMLRCVGKPASRVLFYWLDPGMRDTSLATAALEIISIAMVVIIIIAVGFLSKLFFGKFIISATEKFINHVPFISTVYKTVKQITETFGNSEKSSFSKTVLIEYPKEGCYAIGFLSSETEGEVQDKTGEVVANVFVPTTPNPTSGFLLMVPKKKIISLDMSVADGMKLIISGGIVVPPYEKKK